MGSAVRAEEGGIFGGFEDRANAFVVPGMGAGSDEEGLAGLVRFGISTRML